MAHGTFVWNELLTRDVEGAKRFYGSLLGWSFKGMPMPEGTYWVAELAGNPVGGVMQMPPDLPSHVPAHWFAYLAVSDVDASLTAVTEHGGKVLRPAFDVPEVGRIGIVEDSTGAAVALMTPLPRG